jgi:aminoglycoside phosphotransferase (APT) family kinase protein
MLAKANAQGTAIADSMRAALEDRAAQSTRMPVQESRNTENFSILAANFSLLCSDIASMTVLLRQRSDCADLLRRAAAWEAESHAGFVGLQVPAPDNRTTEDPMPVSALEAYLKTAHPWGSGLAVTSFNRLPGGFGKQTYLVDIEDVSGLRQSLVIRKNDKNVLSTYRSFLMEREFHLLRVVAEIGFPAPKPYWYARDVPGIDAEFMVMEKLPGKMIGSYLEGSGSGLPQGQIFEMAELLAQLHNVDLGQFSDLIHRYDDPALLTDSVEDYVHRSIASWRDYANSGADHPSPLVAYMLGWLEDNVPSDKRRPVLVHGDFGIHNLLGENGRVSGVLDWEGSLFGAPELDLAYLQPAIAKHISWDKFIEHYVACGGRPPMLNTLNYYLVFNNMRILLTISRGATNLENGLSQDIRLVMFELGIIPKIMQQSINLINSYR